MNNIAVIFFSKDRAMQLDAAIRSCRAHCKDLSSVKKFIIYKVSSENYADQYRQLAIENKDFLFVKETSIIEQILDLAASFRFVSFHCDDNMYIRDFIFAGAIDILLQNDSVLAHSFRLGRNIIYSYMRSSSEPQPEFFNLNRGALCFNWAKMKPRGFGYPLELSASVFRSNHILPLISKCQDCAAGRIESHLQPYRKIFSIFFPLLICKESPSVISVPVNRVGIIPNVSGQKHNYPIEYLASKFSEGLRINTSQFDDYISDSTHVELEFSFENRK